MKTLRMIALVAVLATMLFAVGAQAAPTIAVKFGPNQMPWWTAQPNQPFDIWVIAKGIDGVVDAVEYKLNLPSQLIITNYGWPDGSFYLGSNANGYAVGLGDCVPNFGDDQIVVQRITAYAFTVFPEFDVTLTAYEGPQAETPTAPRYSNCSGGVFDMIAEDGLVVGTMVPVQSESFGAIKALY